MGAVKRILRVLPGPIVVYAQSWTSLFANTHFANPEWRIPAENEGVALGTIFMVVLALLSSDAPSRPLRLFAIVLLILTFGLLAVCRSIYFLLGPPEPGAHALDSPWWNEVWSIAYTAAIVSLIATISVAVLSRGEERTRLAWIILVGSILLLLACIAFYFFCMR